MRDTDPRPCFLSLAETSRRLQSRELSPTELVEDVLARIGETEPRLKAYTTILEEQARTLARHAETEIMAGTYRGPLHGVPIAIKDVIDVAGVPTTNGSRVTANRVPAVDAEVTTRLKTAGAILLGKTNTHEFARGSTTPPTRNAWNQDFIPGGSSGGSATAVAAGACQAALGTDSAGSIRNPASVNGVVGLKPTYGRASLRGITPLSWSLDHVGPLTRTVTDAALMLGAIAGPDPADPYTAPVPVPDYLVGLEVGVKGLRLGLPRRYFYENLDPPVLEAVEQAARVLEGEGAVIVVVDLPLVEYALPVLFALTGGEASVIHRRDIRNVPELYSDEVRFKLQVGEFALATRYLRAQQTRRLIASAARDVFRAFRLDAVITPTLPTTAARVGQESFHFPGGDETIIKAYARYCTPFNVTGQPALTVPCGFDERGLPIGLQMVGRPFDETMVLRVARAFERATDWHTHHPRP